jgi:hypothetical protein
MNDQQWQMCERHEYHVQGPCALCLCAAWKRSRGGGVMDMDRDKPEAIRLADKHFRLAPECGVDAHGLFCVWLPDDSEPIGMGETEPEAWSDALDYLRSVENDR